MKLCKDCKHCVIEGPYHGFTPEAIESTLRAAKCSKYGERHPVTGNIKREYCGVIRLACSECGPDAKGFEQREPAEEQALAPPAPFIIVDDRPAHRNPWWRFW